MSELFYKSTGTNRSDLFAQSYGLFRKSTITQLEDDMARIESCLVGSVRDGNNYDYRAALVDRVATDNNNGPLTRLLGTLPRV